MSPSFKSDFWRSTDNPGVLETMDVERIEVDEERVRSFKSESNYLGLSVSLLVEAGSYLCIAGNLYPSASKAWGRDHAVIGGHLVRLFKLIDALLDQTVKRRRETAFVFARLAFECIVNLRFLVAHGDPDIFASYREMSLRHERRLLRTIKDNIRERGGDIWPIEERMISSIERSFRESGLSPNADARVSERNWGGKNLFEKAQAVGLGEAYLGAFAGPSHSVHGNWQDLLEYHLEVVDDETFLANFDWHAPRPQLLETVTLLSTDAVVAYLEYLSVDERRLVDRIRDLQNRTSLLSQLHEEFLGNGTSDA